MAGSEWSQTPQRVLSPRSASVQYTSDLWIPQVAFELILAWLARLKIEGKSPVELVKRKSREKVTLCK